MKYLSNVLLSNPGLVFPWQGTKISLKWGLFVYLADLINKGAILDNL